MTVTHLTGQVLDQVRALPDGSVDLVATSPPFLALRDYNGIPGQWGSEPDPASFLDHLLELTAELRRVLAPHGSIAIELGDTYSGSGGAGGDYNALGMRKDQPTFRQSRNGRDAQCWPLPKSLCGTPTLFAWSLAYGRNLLRPDHTITPWLVRNVIVWARNNPPVGALGDKVRPATSYITVACPSPRRWFDLDAVRVPMNDHTLRYWDAGSKSTKGANHQDPTKWQRSGSNPPAPAGAPPLDHWHDEPDGDLLWLINTQGSSLAHYAMWPPKLVERLILSMCPAHVCRTCGEPRRRITSTEQLDTGRATNGTNPIRHFATRTIASVATLGWSECPCADYRPGHVLDTFAGTGTTLAVADIHGRDATGIDLDPVNAGLYAARYQQCWAALKPDAGTSPLTPHGEQLTLA